METRRPLWQRLAGSRADHELPLALLRLPLGNSISKMYIQHIGFTIINVPLILFATEGHRHNIRRSSSRAQAKGGVFTTLTPGHCRSDPTRELTVCSVQAGNMVHSCTRIGFCTCGQGYFLEGGVARVVAEFEVVAAVSAVRVTAFLLLGFEACAR